MPRFFRSLFGQVVLALVLGVIVGLLWPDAAVKLKPLGDGFIKLIKMIIPVLVFCVVVHGIAGAGDLKRVGRVGVKAPSTSRPSPRWRPCRTGRLRYAHRGVRPHRGRACLSHNAGPVRRARS